MRLAKIFNIAAVVTAVVVIGVAYVLVPEDSWSNTMVGTLIIFSLSLAFAFYTPHVLTQNVSNDDATQMASIGPLGFLTASVVVFTLSAFLLALFSFNKLAIALDILAGGLFVVGALMLRATTEIISNVRKNHSQPSNHIRWQSEVEGLKNIAENSNIKFLLEKLSEKFRYSPSDLGGGTPVDSAIEDALENIRTVLTSNPKVELVESIATVESLAFQRDLHLRGQRNKA